MMNDSFGGDDRSARPTVVDANVKWFNSRKGFGFVTPSDGSDDIFLHVSVLDAAGVDDVTEGMPIRCEVVRGPKGRQVSRLLEINGAPPAAGGAGGGGQPRPRPAPGGGFRDRDRDSGGGGGGADSGAPAVELEGTVKWYNGEKGFGFVAAADGGKDVFIHMSVLRRSGLPSLLADQPVRMMVVATPKGREARQIWLL